MAIIDAWILKAEKFEAEAKAYKALVNKIKKHCKDVDRETQKMFDEMEEEGIDADECPEYTEDVAVAQGVTDMTSQILDIIEKFEKKNR